MVIGDKKMSQDMSKQIREKLESDSLSDEEVLAIAQKVIESGEVESRFILKLKEFTNYCHPAGTYRQEIHTVYGNVKILEANREEDACTKEVEYVIIPETRIAVIIEHWVIEDYYFIYTFSPRTGWVRLSV